jgi:hypothetical protein
MQRFYQNIPELPRNNCNIFTTCCNQKSLIAASNVLPKALTIFQIFQSFLATNSTLIKMRMADLPMLLMLKPKVNALL